MSDYLPLEIQVEIIRKLPVESLVRCRLVSKVWKSVIDSSEFIIANPKNTEVEHLLQFYFDFDTRKEVYLSMVDNDIFRPMALPPTVNMLELPKFVGTSHGLLCFHGYYLGDRVPVVVIWNVTIQKSVAVAVPNWEVGTSYGFGVCPKTADPKIVMLNVPISQNNIRWEVQVFTLRTGVWRSLFSSSNLPSLSIHVTADQANINGTIYWLAIANVSQDGEFSNLIISFDLTSEEFREVNLPESLAQCTSHQYLNISKLSESLVVLNYDEDVNIVVVWKMESGNTKSFIKLFDISIPYWKIVSVLGFRKSSEVVIQIPGHHYDGTWLVVLEPYSKDIRLLGNMRLRALVAAYSYMETLFLIDQPGFIVYDNGRSYNSQHNWVESLEDRYL